MADDPAWVAEHRRAWEAKAALRWYYAEEQFDRMLAWMSPGRTLEVGTGPGYLARHLGGGIITSDVTAHSGVAVCADVHRLPFADGVFGNVAAVDVLHHFAKPAVALREMARVLRTGGRIVLVEPWTGALSFHLLRAVHHESCERLADPWEAAMAPGKPPMDGNLWIPHGLFVERRADLDRRVPGLTVLTLEPFGVFSYLLTGGFQPWGFPAWTCRLARRMEAWLPRRVIEATAVRVLIVLERGG